MPKAVSNMTDLEFLDFTSNVKTRTTADPAEYNLLPADAAAFAVVQENFATKRQAAVDPITRTKITIAERVAAREQLESSLGFLFKKVESSPAVTDAQKIALGITIPKPPSPIGIPTAIPTIVVKGVRGRTIDILLTQGEGEGRGKPAGCHAAVVFSYVGPEPVPQDITKWENQGSCTRTDFTIDFPLSVAEFSKVYLTAAWRNPREQAGPLANPIYTFLGSGVVSGAA